LIGSGGSKRSATIGFMLVTVLIISAMSWATVLTFRQARDEQEKLDHEKRHQLIRQALVSMRELVVPSLAVEYFRPYTDYLTLHYNTQVIWTPSGEQFAPGTSVVESHLIGGSRTDWIELYFHVDPEGVWTSPQIPNTALSYTGGQASVDELSAELARASLARLREALTIDDLSIHAASVHGWGAETASAPDGDVAGPVSSADQRFAGRTGVASGKERRQSGRSRLSQQLGDLSQQACDPADLVQDSIRNAVWSGATAGREGDPSPDVAVEPSAFKPFWLKEPVVDRYKLVFLRTVDADGEIFYQGFTVLWGQLEKRLAEAAREVIPEARPLPVTDVSSVTPETLETMMTMLPVRLEVPPLPVIPAVAVWNSVRGPVIATWAAAIVVLLFAGLGFRNLVILMDRRLQFAYAVTHELRTPLTTFQLYSDMLAAGLVPEESKQQYFDTLNNESKRLSGLVEGVLDYARLENHKVRVNPTTTDGTALSGRMREWFEDRCRRSDVKLVIQSKIPDSRSIHTDIELVNQIIGVLVNNACRHAHGADDPTVLIELGLHDSEFAVEVVDSGPGIDRSDARHIFKPFRRGQSAAATAQGGIGLGLSLARSWANLLGGRLELVARFDRTCGGARFRLTVPVRANT